MSRLVKDLATYGAADFLAKGMVFVYAPILTRLLTPEQYGAGPLLLALWTPLVTVLYGGADWSYPYIKADDKSGEKNFQLVATATAISLTSTLIVWVLFASLAFTGWYQEYAGVETTELLLFLAMILPQYIAMWFMNPLRYMKRPASYARISLFVQVLPVLFALPFMALSSPGMRLEIMWGVGAVVQTIAVLWALREMRRNEVWPFAAGGVSRALAKTMFRFGIVLVPAAFLYALNTVVGRLMVGWVLGPADAGFLQLALVLGGVATMLASWFSLALDPHVIEWVASKDPKVYEPKLQLTSTLLSVAFFSLAACVAIWGDWVIRLLFPPEYMESASLFPVLILCTAFNVVSRVGMTSVIIAQAPKYRLYINLSAFCVNVVVSYVAISQFGIRGAVLGALAAEIYSAVVWAMLGKFALKNLNLDWSLPLVCALVVTVFVLMYRPQQVWTLAGILEGIALSVGVIAAAYLMMRWKLGAAGLKDLVGQLLKGFNRRPTP